MPPPDHRRLPPATLVQLLNSHPTLGTVVTQARLRQHRLAAGLRISADGNTVDFMRYLAWLVERRHAKLAAAAAKPSRERKRKLGPSFTAEPPRFG